MGGGHCMVSRPCQMLCRLERASRVALLVSSLKVSQTNKGEKMTKKATHGKQYTVSSQTLFLAFELGASEWKLGMSVGLGQKARRRTMPARNLEKLEDEIRAAKKRFGL